MSESAKLIKPKAPGTAGANFLRVARMDYVLGDHTYSASYQDLREEHARYVQMTDKRFLKELPGALHFAVFVCWFKELPTSQVLSDEGIVHQLAHLIHLKGEPVVMGRLGEIRELFGQQLRLAP